MRRYKLTEGATKDLIAIWNYTFDTWGEAQADIYIRKIEPGFANIAKGTIVGKQPLSSYPKLHSAHCEHHTYFS